MKLFLFSFSRKSFVAASSLFTTVGLSGCGSAPNADSIKQALGGSANSQVAFSRAAVDGGTLTVQNLVVGKTKVGGLVLGKVSFEPSNQADYAEIQVCRANDCDDIQKTMQTNLTLKPYDAGTLTVKVHACVDPSRIVASKSACSDWQSAEFEQPAITDPTLKDLLVEREARRQQLKQLSAKVTESLDRFLANSQQCIKDQTQADQVAAMRSAVSSFLNVGGTVLSQVLDVGGVDQTSPFLKALNGMLATPTSVNNGQTPLVAASTSVNQNLVGQPNWTQLAAALQQAQGQLAQFPALQNTLGQVNNSLSMVNQNQPMSGLQNLGLAIFDLITAKKQFAGQCRAKQALSGEFDAILTVMKEISSRLDAVDQTLAKQGLVQ